LLLGPLAVKCHFKQVYHSHLNFNLQLLALIQAL